MGLQTYRKKRKFDVTPEPRGRAARAKGNQFVIQKHAARRLHYDLRLELDGVMKSWAVTRGPSLVPGDKRLAVHVEDHPIEYNAFEGTIPQGEYGGGTVMIWDRGRWEPDGDPHRGYKKGHLIFTLEGEKLRGRWHLVRMHGRGGEKKEPWLLIKAKDDEARNPDDPDILEDKPLSVVSGRSIPEIAEGKGRKRVWHSNRSVKDNVTGAATKADASVRRASTSKTSPKTSPQSGRRPRPTAAKKKTAKKLASKSSEKEPRPHGAPLPDFVPPSLATLRATAPSGAGWLHEIKFDGYRIQARLDRGDVRLLTRKGLDWTSKFPNVAVAAAKLPARTALVDGEVVIEDAGGVSVFSGLQAALKAGERERFLYYVFDLLHLDGRDLTGLPLIERKAELKRLVGKSRDGTIRYSDDFEESGPKMLQHACGLGLEGIVSKRMDAPYRTGRSETFVKTKCSNAQEFVVGGYAPSNVQPRAVGALVAGYYDQGRFIYAGRIGTGYAQTVARDLWKRLHPLEIDKPPFDQIPREEARRRDVNWVEPRTVIESEFRGWTADGLVRQAAFKGVREDKPAREVVRELPAVRSAQENVETAPKIAAEASKAMTKTSKAKTRSGGRTSSAPPAKSENGEVRFTHPDRVYWADVGVTKQDLADYYRAAWDWMAPQVVDRPLALVRCPDGTAGQCFFQKHASAGLTEKNLRTVIDSKKRQIIAVEDLNGLLSLVQAGVLEVHVRGSMIDHLDTCDRIVFDIDPGEGVGWAGIVAAARDVRERLAAIDLQSFVKLTGGKGLHVVLPISGADWKTAKSFAQAVALAMTADDPGRYVAKITKSLRTGKIFVDYLRNSLEQTAVAAYSSRARAGAPVSVPVTWEELGRTKGGNQYTVLNLAKRLGSLKQDPWKDIGRVKQKLPDLRTLRKS
ncbi:MAG: bifunctional non-ous end joining protein LigD [Alphaproteobacteria bacterium]|nr:bifunctional non-ous end joining protein LigD [Alphaproteobacteria bacterium]